MKSLKKSHLILVILIVIIVLSILGIFMYSSYQENKVPDTPSKAELVNIGKKVRKHEKNAEKKKEIVPLKEALDAFDVATNVNGIYRIILDEHADKYTYEIMGYKFNGKKAIIYSVKTPALKDEFAITSQTLEKETYGSKKEFLSGYKAINLKKACAISRQTLSSLAYSQVPGAQQYEYEYEDDSTCIVTAIKEKETKNHIIDTDIGRIVINLNTKKISSADLQQYAGATTKYDKDTREEVD